VPALVDPSEIEKTIVQYLRENRKEEAVQF
jgi:hypothetical protein